ncbi:MAG TPA: 30S ribosomal protein S12 methylthiotransferase RimO [Candidatus Hydrogenedens sp.]|nr:30S ribosomal protein S12 methylthiotransferase RimO [Candidatus Hydrogenedens sp.]
MTSEKKIKRVGILTLGCDKNTVDNEYVAGSLEDLGYEVVALEYFNPDEEFDVIILNTCGFILDAKKQSIDAIAEIAESKRTRANPRKFYVFGCLVQRYPNEVWKKFPEIDGLVGVGQLETLIRYVQEEETPRKDKFYCSRKPIVNLERYMRRKIITPRSYSFLKIADGCNHRCSFCAIPKIKGPYRSLPMDIILQEGEYLLNNGVKELNLIAQDITCYGRDLKKGYGLPELIKELARLKGDFWIRCLYSLPAGITNKFLQVVATEPKIVHYLDMPIQHVDKKLLKLMNRPRYNIDIMDLTRRIRSATPDMVLRTTVILAFPGESYRAFQQLLETVEQIRFERLGAFIFSPEEDTAAMNLPRKVGRLIAERRYHILMETQAEISYEFNKSRIGKEYKALVEDYDIEKKLWIGRSYAEAPEVDGIIWIHSQQPLQIGEFCNVKITGAEIYDLYGECVQEYISREENKYKCAETEKNIEIRI